MVDAGGPVDAHAACLKLGCKIVQQFVRTINCFLRAAAPLAPHIAVLRNFGVQRGLFWRNMAIVSAAHDHMLERIPFVPTVYDGLLHLGFPDVYFAKAVRPNMHLCKHGPSWQSEPMGQSEPKEECDELV